MKTLKIYLSSIILLVIITSSLNAQSFTIKIAKKHRTSIILDFLIYNMYIFPKGGFAGSVRFSAYSDELKDAVYSFSPNPINMPGDRVEFKISLKSTIPAGNYKIIVEGKSGELSANDTCFLELTESSPWIIYNKDNSILDGDLIRNVLFDKNNKAWFIYWKNIYSIQNGQWKQNEIFDGYSLNIGSIAVDSINNLWFSSVGNLYYYDGQIHTYRLNNYGLKDTIAQNITVTSNNILWFNTHSEVVKFDGDYFTIYDSTNSELPFPLELERLFLKADKSGNIWIFEYNPYYVPLFKFDGEKWIKYEHEFFYGSLFNIAFDNKNNLYISYHDGIYFNIHKYNDDKFEYISSFYFYTYGHGMEITDMEIDNLGTIWICFSGGMETETGVLKYYKGNWVEYSSMNSWHTEDRVSEIAVSTDGCAVVVFWLLDIFKDDDYLLAVLKDCSILLDVEFEETVSENTSFTFPNPFSERAIIEYNLDEPAFVRINIYNTLGNNITTIVDEFQDVGEHVAIFKSDKFPAGVYFYKLQINEFIQSGKMILIK